MIFFRRTVCIVFPLLASFVVKAQLPYASLMYPLGESETHTIQKLYQDSKGYLWIGTTDGLFAYNGFETQRIFVRDTIKRTAVASLCEDRRGTLWVGYDNGRIDTVNRFHLRAFAPEEGTPKQAISGIAVDAQNRIWFSTSGEGLYLFDRKRLYNLNHDDGLPDDHAYAVLADGASVWAGTDRGLVNASFTNNKKSVTVFNKKNGLPDDVVTALAYDDNHTLWLGLLSNGLVAYNASSHSFSVDSAFNDWDKGRVRRMQWVDHRCWMTTDYQGIWVYDLGTHHVIAQGFEHAYTGRYTDILLDREKLVWTCAGNRLYKTTGETLQRYPLIDDARENVQAVLCRSDGAVWYATNKRVYDLRWDSAVSHGEPLTSLNTAVKNILSFYEDASGVVWMGTFGDGLWKLDANKKLTHFTKAQGLPDNGVLFVTGTSDALWLATLGGVCRLTPNGDALGVERFTGDDALQTSYVYSIFVDSRQRVWFGTDGNGVRVWENGRFVNPVRRGPLNQEVVYSIAEDADENMWFASARHGLYRLTQDSAINYGTAQGLDDYTINGLTADTTGNLVIMHGDGVECLNTRTMQFTFYGRLMGASELQTGLNAFATSGRRTAWIGMNEGLLSFSPPNARLKVSPLLNIRSVASVDADVNDNGLASAFSFKQNFLRVRFDGIWNTDPTALVYQYKLEGYSGPDWVTTRDRDLFLPRLNKGSYDLQLRAGLVNAFNGSVTVSHAFIVNPAWWQTWWFYFLLVGAAVGLVVAIVKIRERGVEQEQRVARLRLQAEYETLRSQVNPHFLFNSFNTLSGIIEESPGRAVEYVEHLSDFFRNMLELREKPLVPLREEMAMTEDYLYLQQKRYGSNFLFENDADVSPDHFFLPPLTMQILMENAFKHNAVSRSAPLRIRVKTENDVLVVSNNVNPKATKEPSTGIGLANVQSRLAMHTNKRMRWENKDGIFTVYVPLIKNTDA